MIRRILATFCLGALAANIGLAAVSPEEAARLGKDLTPMGAEMAGNADGSIPPWNPDGKPIPGEFRIGVKQTDKYFTPKGMARGGVR